MVKKILVDKYDLFVLSSLIHYLINLLYMCEIRFLLFILFMGCLCACGRVDLKSPKTLFSSVSEISEVEWSIEADSLARVEGIQCNDSVLLVFDFYSGKSYSLFDIYSGKMISRLGSIGQGRDEIPLGVFGYIENNRFYIYYDQTGYIGKFNLDSCSVILDCPPVCLAKYKIPGAQISKIAVVNDSLFLAAGTYNAEYQYLLFDNKSNVIDSAVTIYNSNEANLNIYHKFLSNQGRLRKRPGKSQFVYSINNSSNIDFFEIKNNKINLIKSLRFNNPEYTPTQDGDYSRVLFSDNNVIGYIDIGVTDKYVYTLYTNKKICDNNTYNDLSSTTVLVFDWNGNPVKQYELSKEAYYITIDKTLQRMYAVVRKPDMGWTIVCYAID